MFFIFVVVVLFCFPPKFGHTWFKIRLSQHFKSKQKNISFFGSCNSRGLWASCQSRSFAEGQGQGLWIVWYPYIICLATLLILIFTLQKSSQLSDEQHYLLFDIVCLWLWLLPKLVKNYPSDIVQKHHELFHKGCFVPIAILFLVSQGYSCFLSRGWIRWLVVNFIVYGGIWKWPNFLARGWIGWLVAKFFWLAGG
jgi:hypothetical protein